MDTFNEAIKLIDANFIKGIFVSVLVIIFCRKVFQKRLDTENAIDIIKWIMICYSIIILVHFILLALLPLSSNIFLSSLQERATGRYGFAFWLMTLGSISPLILLFKKLGNKIYLVLVLTLFMNVGWMMELFIIHISNIGREYSSDVEGIKALPPLEVELIIILQGIIVGALSVVIGNLPFFKQKHN